MKVLEYKPGIKYTGEPCVLALGFFDGIHLAHRELLRIASDEAKRRGLPLAVFTFPAECKFLKGGAGRIYGTKEKLKLLEKLGVDICFMADFMSLASLSADEFAERTVISELGAVCTVTGYNFRFGKGALGNALLLRDKMEAAGLGAILIDEYKHDGISVSSTVIREHIGRGEIKSANALLGSEYFFSGIVEHGHGEGHTFGFPTVNTAPDSSRQMPRFGVYKSRVAIDGVHFSALTNIGVCPTFTERAAHLETYILGYEGELYGRELDIFLVDFLRDERRFDNKEELIMQIKLDINAIINGEC